MEKMASYNPGSSLAGDKLLEDLQLKLTGVTERLHAIRMLAGVEKSSADARVRANLELVKDGMVTAETALVEYAQSAAIVTDQYVRDKVWNW